MQKEQIYFPIFIFLSFLSCYEGSSFLSFYGRGGSFKNDCYTRVRSHLRLRDIHVDQEVSVRSLLECKNECDRARFGCRSFSFNRRYYDRDNCLLSRDDTRSLSFLDTQDFDVDDDFDFYERDNRLCSRPRGHFGFSLYGSSNRDNCFRLSRGRERLSTRRDIRRSLNAFDRTDCEMRCLNERAFVCRGFYYRYGARGTFFLRDDNCHLTSDDTIGVRDLFDFSIDDNFDFYERMDYGGNCNRGGSMVPYSLGGYLPFGREIDYGLDFNNRNYFVEYSDCFRMEKDGSRLSALAVRKRVPARNLRDCQYECMRARGFQCRSLAFRRSYSSFLLGADNCQLSDEDVSLRFSSYDILPDPEYAVYSRDNLYGRCRYDRVRRDDAPDRYFGRDGGYKTVKGVNCVRQCRLDNLSNYFFCEIDQTGNWDYCCKPGSACVYDSVMQMSRCEVGFQKTQWRTCHSTLGGTFRRAYLKAGNSTEAPENRLKKKNKSKTQSAQKPAKTIEVANLNEIA